VVKLLSFLSPEDHSCLLFLAPTYAQARMYGCTFHKSICGCNFTDVNRACIPILTNNNQSESKSTEIAEVENEDLACWSAAAKPEAALLRWISFQIVVSMYIL
jgi:hypothetical protein